MIAIDFSCTTIKSIFSCGRSRLEKSKLNFSLLFEFISVLFRKNPFEWVENFNIAHQPTIEPDRWWTFLARDDGYSKWMCAIGSAWVYVCKIRVRNKSIHIYLYIDDVNNGRWLYRTLCFSLSPSYKSYSIARILDAIIYARFHI